MASTLCSKRTFVAGVVTQQRTSRRISHIARFQDDKVVKSIDKLVKDEHDAVRKMYNEYQSSSSAEKKQELAYQMIYELATHSGKEEEIWYPAVAKVLGNQQRQHLLDEHMKLKENLTKLSNMRVEKDAEGFDQLLANIMSDFNHHAKQEEEKEMPRYLQESGADGMELGRKFLEAGEHAPTRPHTWAPDKEPLNWLANRLTRPLDDAADTVQNRPVGDKKDSM